MMEISHDMHGGWKTYPFLADFEAINPRATASFKDEPPLIDSEDYVSGAEANDVDHQDLKPVELRAPYFDQRFRPDLFPRLRTAQDLVQMTGMVLIA
jgi:hypothetical protein